MKCRDYNGVGFNVCNNCSFSIFTFLLSLFTNNFNNLGVFLKHVFRQMILSNVFVIAIVTLIRFCMKVVMTGSFLRGVITEHTVIADKRLSVTIPIFAGSSSSIMSTSSCNFKTFFGFKTFLYTFGTLKITVVLILLGILCSVGNSTSIGQLNQTIFPTRFIQVYKSNKPQIND